MGLFKRGFNKKAKAGMAMALDRPDLHDGPHDIWEN